MLPDVDAGPFAGAGALRPLYDATDWSATPLGPVEGWSATLRAALSVVNGTRFPATLLWGPEHVLLYNEPYAEMIRDKHPEALGRTCAAVFPEAMDALTPLFDEVDAGGSTWSQDVLLPLARAGFEEDCWFTWSYSPVRGADGLIEGVLDIAVETTPLVLARRRSELVARLVGGLQDAVDDADVLLRTGMVMAGCEDLLEVEVVAGPAPAPGLTLDPVPDRELGTRCRVELVQRHPRAEARHLAARVSPRLPLDTPYAEFVAAVAAAIGSAFDSVAAAASERAISEALQHSLLTPPVSGPGLDVAVRYRPASQLARVGGDWYDCYPLPDGAVAVMVGDVAGHDQAAAATMGQLRNLARGVAYSADVWTPAQVLEDLDLAMTGLGMEEVATAVIGVLQDRGEQGHLLHWASAGHPPPVVVGADGQVRLLDEPAELLLGVAPEIARREHEALLGRGDLLLLYTDGLVERRGADLDAGLDWLLGTVRAHAGAGPEELCDVLMAEARNLDDDLVLLAVRARGVR
jgi:serine phosphatase RsbU (regulator of sigma subunit)